MELPDYLRLIATRLEAADRDEALRLIHLLKDTLDDAIGTIEAGRPQGDPT